MPVTVYHQAVFAWRGTAPLLGQLTRTSKASADIWFYLLVLVVASMVIVGIGLVLRKLLGDPIEPAQGEAAFNLSDLRRMHREGLLSDEEFQSARAAALAQTEGYLNSADAPQPVASTHPQGVDESLLGPELLDSQDSTPPTGDSDNLSDEPNEAPPGPSA